ncbi:MAG: hypothetical protein JTT11_00410 [Candidatus Brockarchaeota archaeon]|nr:hypothetical protein [Candidatus Brockarchaeota archaeon]
MVETYRSEKVLALSLLLIVIGPLLMYHSAMGGPISLRYLGLAVTASGMLLALLSPQPRRV